jgi:hypothetical protein
MGIVRVFSAILAFSALRSVLASGKDTVFLLNLPTSAKLESKHCWFELVTEYENFVTLAPGLTLEWTRLGDSFDFRAVYNGSNW